MHIVDFHPEARCTKYAEPVNTVGHRAARAFNTFYTNVTAELVDIRDVRRSDCQAATDVMYCGGCPLPAGSP